MLKIISVLLLITASVKSYSSEYLITVKDKFLNEEVYTKALSDFEANEVILEIEKLNDENLIISVKKFNAPVSTLAIKRGGEGGGD